MKTALLLGVGAAGGYLAAKLLCSCFKGMTFGERLSAIVASRPGAGNVPK